MGESSKIFRDMMTCSWSTHVKCHVKYYRSLWRISTVFLSARGCTPPHNNNSSWYYRNKTCLLWTLCPMMCWQGSTLIYQFTNPQGKICFGESWSGLGKVSHFSVLSWYLNQLKDFFYKAFLDALRRGDLFLLVSLQALRHATIIVQIYVLLY